LKITDGTNTVEVTVAVVVVVSVNVSDTESSIGTGDFAVTVYTALVTVVEPRCGLPVMFPVAVLKVKPCGNAGLIEYCTPTPPTEVTGIVPGFSRKLFNAIVEAA
jgi:hypothetical protein